VPVYDLTIEQLSGERSLRRFWLKGDVFSVVREAGGLAQLADLLENAPSGHNQERLSGGTGRRCSPPRDS
jgi:hypothetical protein